MEEYESDPKLLVNFTEGTDAKDKRRSKDNPKQILLKAEELVSKLGPTISALSPEHFVRRAAEILLVDETKLLLFGDTTLQTPTKGLIDVLGAEGVEIMCNRLNEVVQGCAFLEDADEGTTLIMEGRTSSDCQGTYTRHSTDAVGGKPVWDRTKPDASRFLFYTGGAWHCTASQGRDEIIANDGGGSFCHSAPTTGPASDSDWSAAGGSIRRRPLSQEEKTEETDAVAAEVETTKESNDASSDGPAVSKRERKTVNGIVYEVFDIAFDQRVEPDRVSPHELASFEKFITEVDRNPRRLKRIVNTCQLATEVAKHIPVAEDRPEELVYKDERWLPFTSKLIKWLCLCECYPYRMSLLVLIIEVGS